MPFGISARTKVCECLTLICLAVVYHIRFGFPNLVLSFFGPLQPQPHEAPEWCSTLSNSVVIKIEESADKYEANLQRMTDVAVSRLEIERGEVFGMLNTEKFAAFIGCHISQNTKNSMFVTAVKTCWYETITVIFRISCRTAEGTKSIRFYSLLYKHKSCLQQTHIYELIL